MITRRLHEVHEGTAEALTAAGLVGLDELPGPLHPQERLMRVTYRADGSVVGNGTNKTGQAWQPGARCIEVLSTPAAGSRRFRVTVYVDGGTPSGTTAPTERVVAAMKGRPGAAVQVGHPDATAQAVAGLADACALLRLLAASVEGAPIDPDGCQRLQGAARTALHLLLEALALADEHTDNDQARMTIYDAAGVADAIQGACFEAAARSDGNPPAFLAAADVAACARLAARLAGKAVEQLAAS